MWFRDDDDEGDDDSARPTWNLGQFGLSIVCFLSVSSFIKSPINHYFGSGWALLMYFLFLFLFAPPMIYIQLRLGCTYKRGILSLFDKFFPLGVGFGIGALIRNLISVIYISGLMTHCLSYIFFSVYNCDSKFCNGATYMWGSCEDRWSSSDGDCKEYDAINKRVLRGPLAEQNFYFNFVLDRADSIDSYQWFTSEWFQIPALIIVPHVMSWIAIFLTVIGGARVFGYLLYVLAPIAIILLTSVVATVYALYADDLGQKESFMKRFYSNFASQIPTSQTRFDRYEFEPMVWGLLSTFVQLSMTMNIWTGVFPIMGKWIGNGKKRRHLSWIIVILVFIVIGQIPTLLAVGFYSSTFTLDYLRCFVALDYSAPFIVAPHVFSKFTSNKGLAVVYYIALFLFLLLSQSLLFITVIENAVDQLRHWREQVGRHQRKSYVIGVVIAICILMPLSLPTVLRSGYYWIQLIDTHFDRLMCIIVLGQGVAYIISYARSKTVEPKLVKLFCIIFLSVGCLISFAAFIWYIVPLKHRYDQDCTYSYDKTNVTPIPSSYFSIGWLAALAPVLIGLPIAFVMHCFQAKKVDISYCRYLVSGDTVTPPNANESEIGFARPMETLEHREQHPSNLFHYEYRSSRNTLSS